MESSRIYVKGLPYDVSETEVRKYFASQRPITDVRVVPHRRIGFVGFKSPEDAAFAVKYFNKNYLRSSRIGVEIARPVAKNDSEAPRKSIAHAPSANRPRSRDALLDDQAKRIADGKSLKRKRDADTDAHKDARRTGMPPQHDVESSANSTHMKSDNLTSEKPASNGEAAKASDELDKEANEEEEPEKSSKAAEDPQHQSQDGEMITEQDQSEQPKSSDADWLRSRTSRLLDLADDSGDDESKGSAEESNSPSSKRRRSASSHTDPEINEEDPGNTGEHAEAKGEPDEQGSATPDHDENLADIRKLGRLFVRNLHYDAKDEDLRQLFSPFGSLTEVHVPLSLSGTNKGFAYVSFEDSSNAVDVYRNENGKTFQGRLLHILPAGPKKDKGVDDFALSKLPYKKRSQVQKKNDAGRTAFNWNSLYMNVDAVMATVADRLGVSKSDLLDPTSTDAAVKQAHAETEVIKQTKQYFASYGVDLDAFKKSERGETAILIKNFPHGTTLKDLEDLFGQYGEIKRLLLPPAGVIAIVEYTQASDCRTAFKALAYRRFKDSILFLEKAPKDLLSHAKMDVQQDQALYDESRPKLPSSDLLSKTKPDSETDTSTLFVRNLNFSTTTGRLRQEFEPLEGLLSARVKTKPDPKRPGQTLSMGFGFLEFRSKTQASAALSTMDGHLLDGHKLLIRPSHKGADAAEERRKEDSAKKAAMRRTKIIIKNLPFEASKKDVRALFGSYGQLKSIRMPKKFDSSSRGFAFADFVTVKEAENAINALKDTHLLGRRLALDYAAEDPTDAEDEIEKMQRKVGGQANKVALQRLTGQGRKKFSIDTGDAQD